MVCQYFAPTADGAETFTLAMPKLTFGRGCLAEIGARAAARDNWFEAQRIIYEDQGYCFVAVPEEMTALARRFCGVDPNAIGFFVNLHEWYVSEDCAD